MKIRRHPFAAPSSENQLEHETGEVRNRHFEECGRLQFICFGATVAASTAGPFDRPKTNICLCLSRTGGSSPLLF